MLRLGTRGSVLAQAQSRLVARQLEQRHAGLLRIELAIVRTSGDQIADRPLHELGGKGLFTKELEQALLGGAIDFAVHSFKDVPVTMPLVDPSNLTIAGVPPREDPRDVLASAEATSLQDLPSGARVGTGSLRRRCQILSLRPELAVQPIRGNIDTRLGKVGEGQLDAVILAMAGLRRAGLFDPTTHHPIDISEVLPAPGQGALALQCRKDDLYTQELLSALNDPQASLCVAAERELVRLLEGDCHSPIAALAEVNREELRLRAAVGRRDGEPPVVRAEARGPSLDAGGVVRRVFESLTRQNVQALLHPS